MVAGGGTGVAAENQPAWEAVAAYLESLPQW